MKIKMKKNNKYLILKRIKQKALSDYIPIIMDADIGHVAPKMTIINGSIVEVKAEKGKGSITTYLE